MDAVVADTSVGARELQELLPDTLAVVDGGEASEALLALAHRSEQALGQCRGELRRGEQHPAGECRDNRERRVGEGGEPLVRARWTEHVARTRDRHDHLACRTVGSRDDEHDAGFDDDDRRTHQGVVGTSRARDELQTRQASQERRVAARDLEGKLSQQAAPGRCGRAGRTKRYA